MSLPLRRYVVAAGAADDPTDDPGAAVADVDPVVPALPGIALPDVPVGAGVVAAGGGAVGFGLVVGGTADPAALGGVVEPAVLGGVEGMVPVGGCVGVGDTAG